MPQGAEQGLRPFVRTAWRSDVGSVRQRNEDACFTFVADSGGAHPLPLFGLFIVADGMGGHSDGDRASQIASQAMAHFVLSQLYLPLFSGHRGERPPIQEVMEEATQAANRALRFTETENEMGTTLTSVLLVGNRLFLTHVGDSRAYLWQAGELAAITTDHSIVQAMQEAGELTAEQAAVHPNRNLLYRALVGEQLQEIETFTRLLPQQGILLLCSDGLWGLVADDLIRAILEEGEPLQQRADRLVEEALLAGGTDNITVLLVEFGL